jgi:hypothetical protein
MRSLEPLQPNELAVIQNLQICGVAFLSVVFVKGSPIVNVLVIIAPNGVERVLTLLGTLRSFECEQQSFPEGSHTSYKDVHHHTSNFGVE